MGETVKSNQDGNGLTLKNPHAAWWKGGHIILLAALRLYCMVTGKVKEYRMRTVQQGVV